jgi:uncharacterized membrane protein YeaQ/YmgE (transglycosylase-associated protein family)
MIVSFWHWLVIVLVGGAVGFSTGFLTTRQVSGGAWLFPVVGIVGAFLVDWALATVLKLHIDLPVLYNLSLLFWQLVGAILFTQILNLMGRKN